MLTPQAAITSAFRNYATLAGRAPRSEFWWFTLFQVALFAVVILIGLVGIGEPMPGEMPASMGIALGVVLVLGVAFVVPTITLYVRRLHDADLSGWMYFLTCIPYLGLIAVLVFGLLPGKPAGARFDAAPIRGNATPVWKPGRTLS